MQVNTILHKDLADFIESDAYKKSRYLPISRHRAQSHIQNPRAQPNDLVLVLVLDEGEMVGYLGVFPDNLHFTNAAGAQEVAHVGWLSCMWVNPNVRGKGIAKILINTVFQAWEHRILVTEFTPAAKGLYDRTEQFLDLAKPKGLRAYLRLNLAYLLPARNKEKWAKWAWALGLFDKTFNLFNGMRLALHKTSSCPSFHYVGELDNESWNFIQAHRSPMELLRRNRDDLRWVLRYPWLLSGALEDEAAARYHFSSVAKHFSFLNVKIYNAQQEMIGFLMLSIRDKNLKIPYAYFAPEAVELVAAVVEKHLLDLKLDMLTVFHPQLVAYWQQHKGPFFMRRGLQRHYIISKVFEQQLLEQQEIVLQDGDADAAFT